MSPAAAKTDIVPDKEQTPSPDPEPRFGIRNRDLPKQIVDIYRAATIKAQSEERFLRRLEVLRNRLLAFYERGHQHVYESGDSFRLAVAGAPWSDGNGNDYEWGEYIGDYNIFHGFQWILTSVLTQSPTGIAFQPIDPSKSEDNQAATTADGLRQHFNRINDKAALSRETVRAMCLSGRFIRWVKTEANAAKYGRNTDGTPKKERVCRVYNSLASKVPIAMQRQDDFPYMILYDDLDTRNAKQDYSWIRKNIKAGENGLDENNYEKFARLGILQGARSEFQAGESISHLVTCVNVWLRPSCFSDEDCDVPFNEATEDDLVEDEETGEKRAPTVREIIEEINRKKDGSPFEGVHVVFIGKTYAESWAESMDDCCFTGKPFSDESQFPMAVMDGAVQPQDDFNDQMNYVKECFDFGAPREYVNAKEAEFAALIDQKATPWGLTQLKNVPEGLSAQDMVFRSPNPEIPTTMQPYIEFLMGALMQFILACPPSIWGETSADNKTATGQQLATNQAKGRLGIIWSVLQNADAQMYYQVALAAANDPDTPEEIVVPVQTGQNVTIRVERLRKGHFMCKPDDDSGFPDSANQIRGIMTQLFGYMATNPMLAAQFWNPTNMKEVMRIYGLSNFVLPEAEAAERQMEEIEELLDGVPIEPDEQDIQAAQAQYQQKMAMYQQIAAQAQAQGLPAPPMPPPFDPRMAVSDWTTDPPRIGTLTKPSVPIKPWDFDQWHGQACDEYLNGDACRIELQIGRAQPVEDKATGEVTQKTVPNIRGVMNVWLHDQEHKKALAMKQPPPMPQPPPTAPPKGGKPAQPGAPPPQALPGAAPPAGIPAQ